MTPPIEVIAIRAVIELIDRLRMWLRYRAERQDEATEELDVAFATLQRAANKTRAYIADVRADRHARSRRAERELAEAWENVGIALRRLARTGDDEAEFLWKRCFMKAEYWADPELWNEPRLRQAGIGLDKVTNEVIKLIERREHGS